MHKALGVDVTIEEKQRELDESTGAAIRDMKKPVKITWSNISYKVPSNIPKVKCNKKVVADHEVLKNVSGFALPG